MLRLRKQSSSERILKRGPRESLSERMRLSSYYDLISNESKNQQSERKLNQGTRLYWATTRSHSMKYRHDQKTAAEACIEQFRCEQMRMNRISNSRFREYDKEYDIITNKPKRVPGGIPVRPLSCYEILYGNRACV